MIIVEINAFNLGSTGNVVYGIAKAARELGHVVYTFSSPGRSQSMDYVWNLPIGTPVERRISRRINNYTGHQGALNVIGTSGLIEKLKQINPDVIQLHILHGEYLNLEMLFSYLSTFAGRVVWTFHDCWAFTGNCPHFIISGCNKWKIKCTKCEYRGYPKLRRDLGDELFVKKKMMFTSVKNMTIVTPSRWLADLVNESFFKGYDVQVINNGIDLEFFKPSNSNFRARYNVQNKFIVLAVSASWSVRKGIDRLKKIVSRWDCSKYQLVVVGGSKEDVNIDGCIHIPQTTNKTELAEIYSAADVFLNPTREDNFPTVNLEALACGTPVLSYGAGGSAEAFDNTCGSIVDDDSVIRALTKLYINNFHRDDCLRRARLFDENRKFSEYVALYQSI